MAPLDEAQSIHRSSASSFASICRQEANAIAVGEESWLRLSEQFPANDKWSPCRVSLVAGVRALGVTQGGRSPTEGVPGMGTGLEVEVLCGASW